MKKIILILLIVGLLMSCTLTTTGDKYNGIIVKDGEENFYRLEYVIGDTYFIKNITADLKAANDLIQEF